VIFKVVFLVVMHLLFAAIFHHNFLTLKKRHSREAGEFTRKDYIRRLFRAGTGFFAAVLGTHRRELFLHWLSLCSPLQKQWSVVGLYVSFAFLAATGFLFTLLGSIRLFGLPLLLHVSMGGLFAICLAAILFMRAENYFWTGGDPSKKQGIPAWLGKAMFWLFALAGFMLLCSALAMMLPVFSFQAQLNLFNLHRYSALTALTAAIAYLYISAAAKD